MNLAKEISFLLYKHNCVILPGFGAFLVNEKAAELNEVARYAIPKQKVITFNKQIEHNDGLVANYLSQQYKCSYEQGLRKIGAYREYLWQILETKRNAEVAEVGTFYYTQENKLVFVPYHSVNFSTESYGLPKLRLKPVTIAEQVAKPTPVMAQPIVKATPEVQKVAAVLQEETPVVQESMSNIKAELKATRAAERKDKREKAQQSKLDNHRTRRVKTKMKFGNLSIVNTLGSLFLIAMVFAMLNFEMTAAPAIKNVNESASFLDSPAISNLLNDTESVPEVKNKKMLISFGIYAKVKNEEEATSLVQELQGKYAQCEIALDDEGNTGVYIISFTNEELAVEYKNLIQNKLDQKLVINKK